MSPPLMSSPSIASSFGLSASYLAVQRRSQSTSRGPRQSSGEINRQDLAKRLTILAQRLTCGDDIDESALANQVEEMEKAMSTPSSPAASPSPSQQAHFQQSPDHRSPREPGSVLSSPVSSMVRSQLSIMSLQSAKDREDDANEAATEEQLEKQPKMGMTIQQAKKIIDESNKLNEDLDNVIQNLRARQEEADHINALLIERAERAAQRIIFLQKRIAYLEGELQENDDEVQHLRICLKAVEIQLPPHPDQELRRCINVFKDDYRALKTKRANRPGYETNNSTQTLSSPIPMRQKQAMH